MGVRFECTIDGNYIEHVFPAKSYDRDIARHVKYDGDRFFFELFGDFAMKLRSRYWFKTVVSAKPAQITPTLSADLMQPGDKIAFFLDFAF